MMEEVLLSLRHISKNFGEGDVLADVSLDVHMGEFVTLLGACAFRVLWIATVFQVPRFHTPEVVYWSYPISWALTFLTHLVCYLFMLRRLYRREGLLRKHHHLTHPQEE